MALPEITSPAEGHLDELLIRVAQMQTLNVEADDIVTDLAEDLDACDLADARREVSVIAHALRNLTRIGEAHDAKLREGGDD
ncbi:hypothetical protein GCM10009555_018180 [Acrocarpospora macrocephala]|uniref:Uncharacterized protein n=1 Tax=Acrocarpospora macrocephala TaxID=150177 RepID=A0A5M3WMD3_9ACTN|nr:hypothetical protein [Acrocarpospora macrocephala]GES07478.1 hypothetical protein Amac_010730 [Acrocarpospora macrocephala]